MNTFFIFVNAPLDPEIPAAYLVNPPNAAASFWSVRGARVLGETHGRELGRASVILKSGLSLWIKGALAYVLFLYVSNFSF